MCQLFLLLFPIAICQYTGKCNIYLSNIIQWVLKSCIYISFCAKHNI